MEVATKKAGKSGLSLLGCYYFFKLCDKNPEVDISYSIQMDHILKGDTDDDHNAEGSFKIEQENQKKRAHAAMIDMADVTKNISLEIKEMNRLAQEMIDAVKEKNHLAKQSQVIAIAQHLGKHKILEDLFALLSSSSG